MNTAVIVIDVHVSFNAEREISTVPLRVSPLLPKSEQLRVTLTHCNTQSVLHISRHN